MSPAQLLHRGGPFINSLLHLEELGFRSSSPTIKKIAFLAWKSLIDNFALNPGEPHYTHPVFNRKFSGQTEILNLYPWCSRRHLVQCQTYEAPDAATHIHQCQNRSPAAHQGGGVVVPGDPTGAQPVTQL